MLDAFDCYFLCLTNLKPMMLKMAKLFLRNEQGMHFMQMCSQPGQTQECKILRAIVVHTATVLSANSMQPLLFPLMKMMSNPAALTVSINLCQ